MHCRVAEDKRSIEHGTVKNPRIIANALEDITPQQCNDCSCTATAGTRKSCEGMEQTRGEEQGWNGMALM